MDRRTTEGLMVYQRLQMIADNGKIDLDTRTALLGDSREQDFRALLRVLRERVVDATGLLEDGSALGVQGTVQGRVLDSAEFLPLPVKPDKPQYNPLPTAKPNLPPPAQASGPPPAAPPAPAAAGAPAIRPALQE